MLKWTSEQLNKIKDMATEGRSASDVARVMGCSADTMVRHYKRNGFVVSRKKYAGRPRTSIEATLPLILAYDEDITQTYADVASRVGVSIATARSVLERHEREMADAAVSDDKAVHDLLFQQDAAFRDAFLAAHPTQRYEDHPDAANEHKLTVPMRARTLRLPPPEAPYQVKDDKPRGITLWRAPVPDNVVAAIVAAQAADAVYSAAA